MDQAEMTQKLKEQRRYFILMELLFAFGILIIAAACALSRR